MTPRSQIHSSSRRGAPLRWTHETPGAFVPKAELPGLAKDAIQVEAHGRTLTLRGERRPEVGSTDKHPRRRERAYGSFQRRPTPATSVDAEKVQARFKGDILRLQMPNHEAATPRRIVVRS
jgi:HSP20 family protein